MNRHPIEYLIERADRAIVAEDFDTLIDLYADDAVLVVKPGLNAVGKENIRKAFVAIAAHFNHSLNVEEAGMRILESGDTALVLAHTIVSATGVPPMRRNATYVFGKDADGQWRCKVDNSYGHELLTTTSP